MTNNYVQFSEIISNLNSQEKDWWICEANRVTKALADGDEDAWNDIDNCVDFSVKDDCVWFHSNESGDVEKVANVVQKFLKRFRPNECFSLTWASHCSKLRIGEFDGGAIFVTAKEQKFFSGSSWLHDCLSTFKR